MTESNSTRQGLQCHYLEIKDMIKRIDYIRNKLTCHGENILRRTEAVCFGNADGKPNKAQEEVQHHDED